jgi:hypothetical protein
MTQAIEQVYFTWLCDRVNYCYGRNRNKTFLDLMGQLHSKEFVWVVPNDDNRLEDAENLRYQFVHEVGINNPDVLLRDGSPFSVLEIIISLSDRLAFLDGGMSVDWAWKLIENLDLGKYSDPVGPRDQEDIDGILEALIWRTYEPDGLGGFFPLNHPSENQTKVEIWTQMNAYIAEKLENK